MIPGQVEYNEQPYFWFGQLAQINGTLLHVYKRRNDPVRVILLEFGDRVSIFNPIPEYPKGV